MAVLYVFAAGEYIQFNNQNNTYITSIHYTELSFGLDTNGNIQFSHRRETAQLFPIQVAPFAEVLQQDGSPYSVSNVDSFISAFTAALPTTLGSGSYSRSVSDSMQIIDNIAGLAPLVVDINTFDNIAAITIIALAAGAGGAFSIATAAGSSPAVVYPLTTANGIIDTYKIKGSASEQIKIMSYQIPIGGKVLQIVTA